MAKHMRPIAVLYQSPTFSHTLSVGHTLFSGCLWKTYALESKACLVKSKPRVYEYIFNEKRVGIVFMVKNEDYSVLEFRSCMLQSCKRWGAWRSSR